jgi:hypothetical protein
VGRGRDTLRATALVATGWWTVHQLRYLLAYGSDTGRALAHQGHAYLAPAAPALSALLALAAARLLVRAASAPPGRSPRAQRLIAVWPACAATLLGLYVAQESVEGALAAGHPAGAAGIFGHGGWIAVPLAIVIGVAIAAALRVSERLEARPPVVLARLSRTLPRPRATIVLPAVHFAIARPALARPGAGRAPPAGCR